MRVNQSFMDIWNKRATPYIPSEASYSDEEMRPVWSLEYLRERIPKESSTESPASDEKSPEVGEETDCFSLLGKNWSSNKTRVGTFHSIWPCVKGHKFTDYLDGLHVKNNTITCVNTQACPLDDKLF